MRPTCGCRMKCGEKITDEERRQIFTNFWNLKDHNRQWDYVARMVTSSEPKERTVPITENPRKMNSHSYVLKTSTKEVRVCRTMFLNTLGIH